MDILHIPVFPVEVIDFINVIPGGNYADFTFGEGGHSRLLLKHPIASLTAFDRDSSAVERAKTMADLIGDSRFTLIHDRFSHFDAYPEPPEFDGILIDLGVSTRQLLEPSRGFSFSGGGPLDMRMDPQSGSLLCDYLESVSEDELAEGLKKSTDMQGARGVARKVLQAFQSGQVKNTQDLARIMGTKRPGHAHPATVLFMGLRILVNEEFEEIQNTLPSLLKRLKVGGRLVVITFHSTEDRLVKKIFQRLAGRCICEEPICRCPREELVKLVTRKPVEPSDREIYDNPRARSAKLRCIEKL